MAHVEAAPRFLNKQEFSSLALFGLLEVLMKGRLVELFIRKENLEDVSQRNPRPVQVLLALQVSKATPPCLSTVFQRNPLASDGV